MSLCCDYFTRVGNSPFFSCFASPFSLFLPSSFLSFNDKLYCTTVTCTDKQGFWLVLATSVWGNENCEIVWEAFLGSFLTVLHVCGF